MIWSCLLASKDCYSPKHHHIIEGHTVHCTVNSQPCNVQCCLKYSSDHCTEQYMVSSNTSGSVCCLWKHKVHCRMLKTHFKVLPRPSIFFLPALQSFSVSLAPFQFLGYFGLFLSFYADQVTSRLLLLELCTCTNEIDSCSEEKWSVSLASYNTSLCLLRSKPYCNQWDLLVEE